ncbi:MULTISPECIES: glycerol-3-phosphate 1-O-acyltransferase PlsY [Roseateles]|uniref:Glycerol-3-phosphate acyltransferase n=1 Tax=Roseateles albus TaxID=2987525 RepID=A0ABT5KM03_9BURK|nr:MULTISPECIES: glycerol-3-phosphate 1-O-acyltransferase PlsY [Roseateles]MCV2361385.1 glycerol-3-phosphate 1-O-acyltransferase PlsY [Paucibacter sp. TC2R-5]MDC8773881.1 glycerol-3-phosphate 1-O-acyltransferase PlsY [Roseateles albus]
MQDLLFPLLAGVFGYLCGSLSFAVIISRVMGLSDPRSYGSGNPGATNVLRSGNKVAAVLTLLFDALKGYVAVLLVLIFGARFGLGEGTAALVGLTAFLGHLWPVFFRFKGGKGVATAAGVIMALNPLLGAATLATWVIIAYFSRYSSLAALVSAAFAPIYQMLIWGAGPIVGVLVVIGLLLVWRHAENIKKLLKGTESRLGQKASGAVPPADSSKKHPHGVGPHAHGHSHKHPKKKGN